MTRRIRVANRARQRLLHLMYYSVHRMNEAIIAKQPGMAQMECRRQRDLRRQVELIPLEGISA